MKISKLPHGALFIFKSRDPFRDQMEGLICRNTGGGLFQTSLPSWGGPVFYPFHHKDRVKLVERTH